jgi:tetratricopeptide (TPR) repeat protein
MPMKKTDYTRLLPFLLCLILLATSCITFWPVLQNDFVNFDDPDYVTENAVVKDGLTWKGVQWAFTTGHAANWHPATWLSHMLDVTLFGLKPMGHHLTSLLFHGANSVLLLLLLRQMTGAVWRSALVAGLFALHPLHVESVAWVAERKDVLSTFFGLLTLMAYAAYAKSRDESRGSRVGAIPHPTLAPNQPTPGPSQERSTAACARKVVPLLGGDRGGLLTANRIWYGAALGLFACGLMSKPMLVTWPFVMLLLDFWPLNRIRLESEVLSLKSWRLNQKVILEKIPFLVVVAGSCVVTYLVQQSGQAVSSAGNLPLTDRLENAVASYLKYLGKTIWPTDLAVFYPHPETRYPISSQWPLGALVLAALVLVGVSVLTFRRIRHQPYLAVGWFWYLGTLVPVIGIIQVGTQAMADRYTYIPLIGFFVALVWLGADFASRMPHGKATAGIVSLIGLLACSLATRGQIAHWRDSFSLFQHAVEVTTHNAPALANLGTEHLKCGNNPEAIRLYQAALEANPHYADASYGLGLIEQNSGKLEEAAGHYRHAIQIRPDHVLAQHNLGTVLWLQGKPEEAKIQFATALDLRPDFFEAHLNLGSLLLEQGQALEAQLRLQTALRLNPDHPAALLGLALALKRQGHWTEAETALRNLLRADPEHPEALLNLGVLLVEAGQTNEAAPYLSTVNQRNPRLSEELVLTGQNLLTHGNNLAAEDCFVAAACLNPTNAPALENLALLRAQGGKLDDASHYFTRALQLRPSAESYYYLAVIQALQGQVTNTIKNLQQAITLQPDHLAALNELAWLLATHPQTELRDGARAVELAERACRLSGEAEPRYWGTLDAAYAEAGRFAEAIQTAEKTITLARAKGQSNLVENAEARLNLYQQNKAFRQ